MSADQADDNGYSFDASPSPYRYDATGPCESIEPPSVDLDDSRSPYIYDGAGPSPLPALELMVMPPCYPWITYDAVPQPELCDDPHVVDAGAPEGDG